MWSKAARGEKNLQNQEERKKKEEEEAEEK